MNQDKQRKIEFTGQDGFTTVYNSFVRDSNLSFKARGLMLWIQSHDPEKFKLSKGSFRSASKKDGTESINSAIRELKVQGYLEIKRVRDEKGVFIWVYRFHKGGQKLSLVQENKKTDQSIGGKSIDGFSMHGFSIDGKPPHIRNNKEEITIKERTRESNREHARSETSNRIENISYKECLRLYNEFANKPQSISDSKLVNQLLMRNEDPSSTLELLKDGYTKLKEIEKNYLSLSDFNRKKVSIILDAMYIYNNYSKIFDVFNEIPKDKPKQSENKTNSNWMLQLKKGAK
jgi:hypothetical protein